MSELTDFLRTKAHEHYEGIINMGYSGSVKELKLWQAADRIEELENKLEQAKERLDWLACLEAAGVDNWQGIDMAIEMRNESSD